jgi:hypothetical protein
MWRGLLRFTLHERRATDIVVPVVAVEAFVKPAG